jgi:KDO2-lipid IV(A) lauroyltransferase
MNPPSSSERSLLGFWQPRFWPAWLGIGLLRLLVMLPFRLQVSIGASVGRLMYLSLGDRRRVADVNLRLCFPDLPESERRRLLRMHFSSLGIGLFELGMAWWASDQRVRSLVRLDGIGNLQNALSGGRGALIVSGHFAATELTGRAVQLAVPNLAARYRPNRNPLVDQLLRRGRSRVAPIQIPKDNIRQLLRALKQGAGVWYASDQSYRRQHSVLVPFFGEPAMTNGALTHIARLSGAPVVPYFPRRLPKGRGYEVTLLPALKDFPTTDIGHDARRINALIEERIRLAPEQYYWIHRRFKGRPDQYPDPYRRPAGATAAP